MSAYTGGMVAFGDIARIQRQAEAATSVAECGHEVDQDGQVALTGESQVAGSPVSPVVPNLDVQHVQTPVTKRGLPSDLQTNPLTAGRPRGQR
jgi:hypothetical protein